MTKSRYLLENNKLTRTILETVGALVVVMDTDGTIVYFNRACQNTTGFTEAEALGRAPWDFLLPEAMREPVKGVFAKLTAGDFPSIYENAWLTKDGDEKVIAWTNSVTLNDDQSIQYVIGTGIDISERANAERNLKKSEHEVRTILETMTDTFYRTDAQGCVTMLSNSVEILLGYSVEELIGKKMTDLYVDPQNRDELIRKLQQGNGCITGFEARLRHKDGREVWISASSKLLRDKQGGYAGIEGTVRDITENINTALALQEAHAELETRVELRTKELKKSETRLRAITESTPDAIISVDKGGQIIQWNLGAEKMFGYQAAEVMGQSVTILMPQRYQHGHTHGLKHFMAKEGVRLEKTSVEVDALRKDGCEFPVELTLSDWRIDNDVFVTSIIRDISERKEAEDMLRKLSRALEQSPSAVFITNTQGTIEYVNPRFTKLTGYTPEEAIGKNPRILKSKDTPRDVHVDMWRTIEAGKEWRGEIKDTHKNGSQFWAYVTIAPVKDEEGTNTHYVATHEDISQRKDAEHAVQSALKEAEFASRAKSELMANMSHELRTPLNAIIGFSSTIQAETFGPIGNDKYREYLDDINNSGQHLLELINDILDVSAIEAGMLELHKEPFAIGDVLDASIRFVKHRAEQGDIHLIIDVQGELPPLVADERRVKQIILNLLTNAIKFTPPGGSVSCIASLTGDGSHVLTVSDTGIGMSKVELIKAMAQFGQVDSSLSRKHEGTGLGLPLTQGLVELHGGMLKIESEKGKGTMVIVRFPKPA